MEPYATPRLSVPIGAIGTYPGAGAARVGLRYRLGRFLSLGGGAGTSFFVIRETEDHGYGVAGLVDLELALGHRWRWFGLSFAFRPTYQFPWPSMLTLPVSLAFAFYVSERWAINVLTHGGAAFIFGEERGYTFAGGGGLGVLGHL